MSNSTWTWSKSRIGRGFAGWILLLAVLLTPRIASASNGELDHIQVLEIDPRSSPEKLLAARPFLVAGDGCPEFCIDGEVVRTRLDEAEARERLTDFLRIRDVQPESVTVALARFDAPETIAIVSNPALRASLLMMSDWDPYQAIVAAVLDGRNQSGRPFADVSFVDLGSSAIAYLDASGDRYSLRVNDAFATEAPETLVNVLVHEALHDPYVNSFHEEVIANILDGVAYAEMVLLRPDLATAGSTLTIYNNFALLALLNSSGAAGPDHLGVSTSRYGDVWIGDDLGQTDAGSLYDAIAGDSVYAALPPEGSRGNDALAALLRRFAGAPGPGARYGFDDTTLTLIDQRIGKVISPANAMALATALDLVLGSPYVEFSPDEIDPLPRSSEALLRSRPLVPRNSALFDPALPSPNVTSSRTFESVRRELQEAIEALGVGHIEATPLLALYDSAGDRLEDVTLRATWVLAATFPGAERLSGHLDGTPGLLRLATTSPVEFAPLLHGTTFRVVDTRTGSHRIAVNRDLASAPLPLLAVTLIEALLSMPVATGVDLGMDQAVLAAAVATVTYAQSVIATPDVVSLPTWLVTTNNHALLAMLNSAPVRLIGESDDPNRAIGLLDSAEGVADVLPNLYPDTRSYEADVQTRPGAPDLSATRHVSASPLAVAIVASLAGVDPANMAPSPTYGELIAFLDARLGAILPPESVALLAGALDLGVILRTSR